MIFCTKRVTVWFTSGCNSITSGTACRCINDYYVKRYQLTLQDYSGLIGFGVAVTMFHCTMMFVKGSSSSHPGFI